MLTTFRTKLDLSQTILHSRFRFDLAFDECSTNQEIYNKTIKPLIASMFEKQAKITCFAFGQTGSGKTYTMIGNNMDNPGLYLLSSYDIFSLLQMNCYADYDIWVSFFEIYCNRLYDLLNNKQPLEILEDAQGNMNVVGLCLRKVISVQNLLNIISFGLNSRTVGITGANPESSRSHAVLKIELRDQRNNFKGNVSFVDLAGSERAVDAMNSDKKTK